MKREKFLNSLKIVMYGVDKGFSDINLVYFDDGWARSFSDRMYISCPVGSSFKCQVDSKILYGVLSKMSDSNVRIRFKEGKLIVEGRKSKLKLSTLQGMEIPQRFKDLIDEESFVDLPKDFLDGLRLCHTSAATGGHGFGILNGVHVKGFDIFACDNFRMSRYRMEQKIEGCFTLPFKSAQDLLKSNLNIKQFFLEDKWVHFLDPEDRILLSSVTSIGDYPVENLIGFVDKREWSSTLIEFPESLSKVIDRAKVLSSEMSGNIPFILLKLNTDNIEVIGEREFGEYYEKIDCELKVKENISFKASPDFLKDILKITSTIQISKDVKALLFSTNNFKHLVLTIVKRKDLL